MGLDMYLNARRDVSKYYNNGDETLADNLQAQMPELANLKGRWQNSPVSEVVIEAGYWRKANQIHRWFVENVQEGHDDCERYDVAREDLEELRTLCKQVLDFRHLAVDKLPPQSGFFFGNTDINEYYWADIEQTIQILDDCLSLPEIWHFEYQSSW